MSKVTDPQGGYFRDSTVVNVARVGTYSLHEMSVPTLIKVTIGPPKVNGLKINKMLQKYSINISVQLTLYLPNCARCLCTLLPRKYSS